MRIFDRKVHLNDKDRFRRFMWYVLLPTDADCGLCETGEQWRFVSNCTLWAPND